MEEKDDKNILQQYWYFFSTEITPYLSSEGTAMEAKNQLFSYITNYTGEHR